MTAWQKAVKYAATVLAVILAISIIGGIVGVFSAVSFLFGDRDITSEMKTYDIQSEINELKIDISAAALDIEYGDTFRVESNHKYLTVKEDNGKLTISEERHFGAYSGDSVKIELYIPSDTVFETADIVTGAGVVNIEGLAAENIKMEFGAGKVDIERLIASKSADIDGGTGKISVKGGALCDLELNMGVGELELVSALSGGCEFDCGVGAVSLTLIGTAEDYRIDIDKGIGAVSIDGQNADKSCIYGNGSSKIDIDCGIGKTEIHFETDKNNGLSF